MAYPGEGYKMSNYGLKTYTPEQIKEVWRESIGREIKIAQQHNATKAKAQSQAEKSNLSQVSYYNNGKEYKKVSTYNQTFNITEGYNQKLKRDDLQHTQGLNIKGEEERKSVPILSNSVYGTGKSLEIPTREHVRVAVVKREFYRSGGTNLQPCQ